MCALGLRCIVDVEFSRWRRRSEKISQVICFIFWYNSSYIIVLFWESYPQLHKLILIQAFSVKEKNNIPHSNLKTGARVFILYEHEIWTRCLESYNFYHIAHWRQNLVLSVFTKIVRIVRIIVVYRNLEQLGNKLLTHWGQSTYLPQEHGYIKGFTNFGDLS